jgi:hypothetical protein
MYTDFNTCYQVVELLTLVFDYHFKVDALFCFFVSTYLNG